MRNAHSMAMERSDYIIYAPKIYFATLLRVNISSIKLLHAIT